MRFNQILALLAAAECGSIRAAARRENLSQPALSQLIRRLEDELGVSLLDRSTRGVRLTEYGEALRTRGALIRTEFDRALTDIHQLKGGTGGDVKIGLITSISLLAAPRAIRQFKKRYPDVRISIVDQYYDDALIALREGKLDFAIGPISDAADSNHLTCDKLFETELVPLVRRGHPKAHARTLAEVSDQQWIAPVDSDSTVIALFERMKIEPPVLIRCRSMPAWLPLILENDAIMMLPRILLRSPMLRTAMQALRIPEATRDATYYVFSRSDSALTPAAAELARHFRDAVREMSAVKTAR